MDNITKYMCLVGSILLFRPSLLGLGFLGLKSLFSYPLGDGVILRMVHGDSQANHAGQECVEGVRAPGESSRYSTKKVAVGTLRRGGNGRGGGELRRRVTSIYM